jgi:hypothetical protein
LPPPKAARRATAAEDFTNAFSGFPSPTASLTEIFMGRSILLWLLGVPIPIIILLAIFWH